MSDTIGILEGFTPHPGWSIDEPRLYAEGAHDVLVVMRSPQVLDTDELYRPVLAHIEEHQMTPVCSKGQEYFEITFYASPDALPGLLLGVDGWPIEAFRVQDMLQPLRIADENFT
jgi:hypothetical protein